MQSNPFVSGAYPILIEGLLEAELLVGEIEAERLLYGA